jgi:hypothetical protein
MAKVTEKEYTQKVAGIEKFYAYHQIQVDPARIEFGWVDISDANVTSTLHARSKKIVIARDSSDSSWDNITLLEDYRTYFLKLTSLTPNEFIERWSPSMKELKVAWETGHLGSPENQHEFFMKIALLVRDGISFEMWGKEYEVIELESGESDEEGGDKA